MNRDIKVGPSILAADFSILKEEIKRTESAGVDFIHCDVMDGHFVPNITFGPLVIRAISRSTDLSLDVHLMIENPEKYIEVFKEAGADIITVHTETLKNPVSLIKQIKNLGLKAGISLNPSTPAEKIKPVLNIVDLVLVMMVNPGFGGQDFISDCLSKIKELRNQFAGDIEVDGGINDQTAKLSIEAGANMIVAGTYLFNSSDMKERVRKLKNLK
jgi:ribulose-phosphate 3-epimerase